MAFPGLLNYVPTYDPLHRQVHIPAGLVRNVAAPLFNWWTGNKYVRKMPGKRKRTGSNAIYSKRYRPRMRRYRRKYFRRKQNRFMFKHGYKKYTRRGLRARRYNPRVSQWINPYNRTLRHAFVKHYFIDCRRMITPADAGVVAVWQSFRGNGLYSVNDPKQNPLAPTVANSASNIKLLEPKFNEYIVLGSKITIQIFSHVDTVCFLILMASTQEDPPTINTIKDLYIQKNAILTPVTQRDAANNIKVLKLYRTMKNMLDVDQYESTVNGNYKPPDANPVTATNPTVQWYYHVGLFKTDLNALTGQIYLRTNITYYTKLETPDNFT